MERDRENDAQMERENDAYTERDGQREQCIDGKRQLYNGGNRQKGILMETDRQIAKIKEDIDRQIQGQTDNCKRDPLKTKEKCFLFIFYDHLH